MPYSEPCIHKIWFSIEYPQYLKFAMFRALHPWYIVFYRIPPISEICHFQSLTSIKCTFLKDTPCIWICHFQIILYLKHDFCRYTPISEIFRLQSLISMKYCFLKKNPNIWNLPFSEHAITKTWLLVVYTTYLKFAIYPNN